MEARHVYLLFCGAFIVAFLNYFTRPDPLKDVPGPWLAKYTSLLLAYHTRTGKRFLYIDSLHQKYGPLVRITPTQVSCSSPDAPSIIYAQGSSALSKTPFYRAFYVSGTPSLFSTQDRFDHASKRRVLAHPFSYSSVKQFESWIQTTLGKFINGLDARCLPPSSTSGGAEIAGRPSGGSNTSASKVKWVDMLAWFNYMTFDVISDLAFGEPLGMVDRGSDILDTKSDATGVAAMIDYRGRTAAFLGLFPAILPPSSISSWCMWILANIIPDEFISRGLNSTDSLSKIARKCVRRRLSEGGEVKRGDLLDRLVEGLGKQDEIVQEDDVVTEAMLLLTAGSDTTANSSAAILFHILRNPRVHKALLEELSQLEIDEGEEGLMLPSHDQVKNLPYLQATIDEGLRKFATNAFGLPRVVSDGSSVEISGKLFPPGIELSAPAWSIQHDPSVWGDPFEFRPERWLEDGNTHLKKHLLTFGMGPRMCIGKNLAYMQMQLMIATVILRYDFELRDETLESVEGFMHKPVDLWVTIKRRD
ncbi:benzoate para-hydroxylase [Pluteus cervinus]|uniref:Benzoate para-hydroxylase n=1 Tax=Pluteus cervinus TaxID=181527 RepID=A0ACD3B5E6_9AGAR|nr:benzoate para-hydroxylase [Pluteus cervinus]